MEIRDFRISTGGGLEDHERVVIGDSIEDDRFECRVGLRREESLSIFTLFRLSMLVRCRNWSRTSIKNNNRKKVFNVK